MQQRVVARKVGNLPSAIKPALAPTQTSRPGGFASPVAEVRSLAAPGRALDADVRRQFEDRLGYDLSRIRVHDDADAHRDAARHRALAFTVGDHIVFGEQRFNPRSDAGARLLAHELVHARQQALAGRARLDRFADCSGARDCPPREPGEIAASRSDPMEIHGVTDPPGILVAGYAIASSRVKPSLVANPTFSELQANLRARPDYRWEILGFSDCEGAEGTNSELRASRASSLLAALPTDLRSLVTGTTGAPLEDCMQPNATARGRQLNRSAFLRPVVTAYDFPESEVSAAPPAPSHLYGVTSPASQYFVRASPDGERIGQLLFREMNVRVIGESGSDIDHLWLQVEFSADDMAEVTAAYAASMQDQLQRLPQLQARRAELRGQIQQLEDRPGMAFEVAPEIQRRREALAPVEADIQQIEQYQRRLIRPYDGRTAWIGAAALGVTAMHYDTFLELLDAFDREHASEPLRDRLTRLRQLGEDASLEGDIAVGRGRELPDRVTQSDRANRRGWQLLFEAKQVRMPNGQFIDIHHFILGLDALALPRDAQSSERVMRQWVIASVNIGESWSAATWSGDIGGAVGDYVLHRSGAWEAAHTRDDNDERRRFYYDTRAPEMDLLADLDSWGAFGEVPRTNTQSTSFNSLRQVIEATYGPARQTAEEYQTQVAPQRRRGIDNFLCNYRFTSPTGLVAQSGARGRVLEQVRIFATAWYDIRAGGLQPVLGRQGSTDAAITRASEQMTDMYLQWLEAQAASAGLNQLSCADVSSPLRGR